MCYTDDTHNKIHMGSAECTLLISFVKTCLRVASNHLDVDKPSSIRCQHAVAFAMAVNCATVSLSVVLWLLLKSESSCLRIRLPLPTALYFTNVWCTTMRISFGSRTMFKWRRTFSRSRNNNKRQIDPVHKKHAANFLTRSQIWGL